MPLLLAHPQRLLSSAKEHKAGMLQNLRWVQPLHGRAEKGAWGQGLQQKVRKVVGAAVGRVVEGMDVGRGGGEGCCGVACEW